MTRPLPRDIAPVFDSYPDDTRTGTLALRDLILEIGGDDVTEALRWGQPAYLAPKGSTLRVGPHKDARFALFAHCQSTIISSYGAAFPGWDRLDGNRAVLFDTPKDIEPERLSHLIRHALSYHKR
ncbi:DUF1801 domain-containing protein [Roseovarius sp. 2305UL8-3]|uniref:DUF1801 domain-containing protein n=1 Tax=Roseovarius conchicola TaxID=3121636 RepID=UPI003528BC8F